MKADRRISQQIIKKGGKELIILKSSVYEYRKRNKTTCLKFETYVSCRWSVCSSSLIEIVLTNTRSWSHLIVRKGTRTTFRQPLKCFETFFHQDPFCLTTKACRGDQESIECTLE